MSQCEVKGLGNLPCNFSTQFNGVNIEDSYDANGHHEGRVRLYCDREPWYSPDDNIVINGVASKEGGYNLSISFDSESSVRVFNNGRVDFSYDPEVGHWMMKAWRVDGDSMKSWELCDPFSMVALVENAIACYSRSEQASTDGFRVAVDMLLKSISEDKKYIEKTADLYHQRKDCAADSKHISAPVKPPF